MQRLKILRIVGLPKKSVCFEHVICAIMGDNKRKKHLDYLMGMGEGKMIVEMLHTEKVKGLFENWEETLIWSCIQGVMGRIYADEKEHPKSAMAILGDFCFFAGEVKKELIAYKPEYCKNDFIIMVPKDADWSKAIEEVYGNKAKKVTRYAIKKEQDIFDVEKLEHIVNSLLDEYQCKVLDETDFMQCKKKDWAKDLVSQYESFQEFQKLGLGIVILKNGDIVAGASSYARYKEGIEIEIDTKESDRRKGLASVCGAKLILECLSRGLYPSWDAQNLGSVALAEKLGYHFSHEYTAYEIWGY